MRLVPSPRRVQAIGSGGEQVNFTYEVGLLRKGFRAGQVTLEERLEREYELSVLEALSLIGGANEKAKEETDESMG